MTDLTTADGTGRITTENLGVISTLEDLETRYVANWANRMARADLSIAGPGEEEMASDHLAMSAALAHTLGLSDTEVLTRYFPQAIVAGEALRAAMGA